MEIRLKSDGSEDRRISAMISFDTRKTPPLDVWLSSDTHDLGGAPGNVFVVAAYLAAWRAGERSIDIDCPVDPLIVANLSVVAQIIGLWDRRLGPPPVINAATSADFTTSRGVGLFLSGGVDSVASLATLTKSYPPEHPRRPTHAILIDYQAINRMSDEEAEARYSGRRRICEALSNSAGVQLIAIRTNLRLLDASGKFWAARWHGAVLASVAHAVSNHIGAVNIASTKTWDTLEPWGSHPALDHLYSGRSLQSQHHGFEMSRMDKIRSFVDWQDALDLINVCTSRESGGTNCGSCEKCLRTRVQLLACGALADAGAFAGDDVDPSELASTIAPNRYSLQCFTDALEPLRQMGRQDLADAIEDLADRSERDNAVKRLLRKISKRLPAR